MKVEQDKVIMYHRKPTKYCICFGCTSLLLIISGITIISIRTMIYNNLFNSFLSMAPDSVTYQTWKRNPVPLKFKVFVFNWTNPQEILNKSKPVFHEVGPYMFDETKEKANITWHQNDTVSFYHLKKWWFDPELTKGSLADQVNTIAPIPLTTAVTVKDWSYFSKTGVNVLFSSMSIKLHDTHSIGEILFDGYEEPVLNAAKSMPFVQNIPNFDKFGWFYSRNNSITYEGSFNMGTGNSKKFGELYTWKHMNDTPYFPEHCGKIRGSAGEFFSTNLKKSSIISFFSPDMCRYVELEFEREVYVSGIRGYKYSARDRFLDNGTNVPENACFSSRRSMPSGVLDVSSCRYGSPAFVSLPHFYKADGFYTESVQGLEPEDDLHNFYMIFEPTTGIPLEVAARLQLNLLLQEVPGVKLYQNVPNILMPVLWFEQTVSIPGLMAFQLIVFLNLKSICLITGAILIVLGAVLEAWCCYKLCTMKIFQKKPHVITREQVPLTETQHSDYKIVRS